jgi:hypothetical protein
MYYSVFLIQSQRILVLYLQFYLVLAQSVLELNIQKREQNMSLTPINLGTYANDGTGDDLRTAFTKVNNNFAALQLNVVNAVSIGVGQSLINSISPVGAGQQINFKSIAQGNNIIINNDGTTITVATVDSINALVEDPSPYLGNTLNLNSHNITGSGNIEINGSVDITGGSGNFIGNVLIGTGTSTFNNITSVGMINGDVIGTLMGAVTGTVSDISNHLLSDLADVSSDTPLTGDALSWNGLQWAPTTLEFTGNVVGPTLATNNAIPVFADGTGILLKNSLVTIADDGTIRGQKVANLIPFYYPNKFSFPTPATVTGAVAYSSFENALYYSGLVGIIPTWIRLLSSKLTSNIDVNNNTITTTVANGNVVLQANGTGLIKVNSTVSLNRITSDSSIILDPVDLSIGSFNRDASLSIVINSYPDTDTKVSKAFTYSQTHTNANAVPLTFYRTKAIGFLGVTPLADGDQLGGVRFDGISDVRLKGADIVAYVDGTPSAGSLPTSLQFTTNDGTDVYTWKMGADGGLTSPILSSAPASPIVGSTYIASGSPDWDPVSKGTGVPYPVFWDGVSFNSLY